LPQAAGSRDFAPLINTYGTVPYADINPAVLAGMAYVVMFGIMFADVGHGGLLVLAALATRLGWSKRLARLRPVWLFLALGGIASMAFGVLYGEFFGPTQVVPTVWIAPLDQPLQLLGAAVALGALLLAGAYALGTVNRFHEGGWRMAAYAPSGLAGSALFFGIGAATGGWYLGRPWLVLLGGMVALGGLSAAYLGLLAAAGGGGSGAAQAAIELFDMVVRLVPTWSVLPGSARSGSPTPPWAWSSGPRPWRCGNAAWSVPSARWFCSCSATRWCSGWRVWWRVCRRCGWSTTNSSPGCSTARAGPSGPGTFP
jgi:V/A-type H+-transporting ATPase subunit I